MKALWWFGRKFCTTSKEANSSILEIIATKPLGAIKTVKGWVKSLRKSTDYIFIDVSDGTCNNYLQIVISKKNSSQPLQWGASVDATGKIQVNSTGQLEMMAENLNIVGKCNVKENYPFTRKQKQSYDHYRQYLHFRYQIEYFTSLLRFRHASTLKVHDYFTKHGFVGIHTPIITGNDCEGAGEIFRVQPNSDKLNEAMRKDKVSSKNAFFDSPAYLTVSGQLHLEAVARSISKIYTFNPSFRAENSKSRLHLSEFYMIEAEEAFVTNLEIVLQRIENCIKELTSSLVSKHSNEIEYMLKHNETDSAQHLKMLENVIMQPFTVMTFSEAKSLIQNNKDKIIKANPKDTYNFTKEEELFIVDKNNNTPVFVIDWPKNAKPFYMKECIDDPHLVKGVDLLVPNVGELCGGGLREDNYDILENKLKDLNILDNIKWYLEIRKFGNVPTAGFGIGFERFLQFLLNVQNIKDTIPFPRWPHGLQL